MTAIAALVTAIAALVAAIAWPIAFLVIFFMFRGPLSAAFEKLPSAISRMQKLKLGSFEAELEAEAKGLSSRRWRSLVRSRPSKSVPPLEFRSPQKGSTSSRCATKFSSCVLNTKLYDNYGDTILNSAHQSRFQTALSSPP